MQMPSDVDRYNFEEFYKRKSNLYTQCWINASSKTALKIVPNNNFLSLSFTWKHAAVFEKFWICRQKNKVTEISSTLTHIEYSLCKGNSSVDMTMLDHKLQKHNVHFKTALHYLLLLKFSWSALSEFSTKMTLQPLLERKIL